MMETKQLYEIPTTTVVEMMAEGMVCQSNPNNQQFTLPGFGDVNEI